MGKNEKIKELMYLQLKGLNFLKKVQKASNRLGKDLVENKNWGDNDLHLYSFQIFHGEKYDASEISLQYFFNNDSVVKTFDEYSNGLDISEEDINIVLKIKCKDPKASIEALEEKIDELKILIEQVFLGILDDVDFKYGIDEDYILFGIIVNKQLLKGRITQMVKQLNEIFGDKISSELSLSLKLEKGIEGLLNHTILEGIPEFKFATNLQINGCALKNYLLDDFKYMKEDWKYQKGPVLFELMAMLLQNAEFNLMLNKVDFSKSIIASPLGQMKDMTIKEIINQFSQKINQTIELGPPIVKQFLELFYKNFIADVGVILYIPRLCFEFQLKTKGFKQLYEIFYPPE